MRRKQKRMEWTTSASILFQGLTQAGKLSQAKGWNLLQDASAKDGSTYRALFCDSCGKNYNNSNVRLAKIADAPAPENAWLHQYRLFRQPYIAIVVVLSA